jgi:hypothetical protein
MAPRHPRSNNSGNSPASRTTQIDHRCPSTYPVTRELRWHWGEAYETYWAGGQFTATRRDNGGGCPQGYGTAHELREEISRDYSAKPVPRDLHC